MTNIMQNRIILLFIFLIVVVLPVSGIQTSSTELLKNPGFNLDSNNNGIPDNWWIYNSTSSNVIVTRETGRSGVVGDYSWAFKYPSVSDGVYIGTSPSPVVIPGKTYKLSGWLKMDNTTSGGTKSGTIAYIEWLDSGYKKISNNPITDYLSGGNNTWQQYSGNVTAPTNASYGHVRFDFYNSAGKVWIDDFSLKVLPTEAILYNIVHKKYIYLPQNIEINFSIDGLAGASINVTVTSPSGIVMLYNIIKQNSSEEDESITYTGVNELGVYNVTYSAPTVTKTSTFEYKRKPVLTFVSASDQHYGYGDDTISSGFTINRFISGINNQAFFPSPDFVVLVGDTADNLLYNHIADSKTLYDTFNIPYYITMGNHEPSYNATIYEAIGYKGQTFYNSYGSKYNYTITKNDYTFIFGGVTGDYPPLTKYVETSLGATNYSAWLDKVLATSAYKPTIVFSHYSAQQPRDAGGAQSMWEDPIYGPNTRAKFEKYKNMPVEFAGHSHIVSKNITNNITYVNDGAIINEPFVFDYVEIYPDKIQVHTIKYRLDTDPRYNGDGIYWSGSTDSTHDTAHYSQGNPDENEFTITLVNITSIKLTNLWNFTANDIPANKITLGNNIIRNSNVLVNLSAYESRYIINMTTSTSSEITVDITTFNSTLVKFNESSSDSTAQVSYEIGDRVPNQPYRIIIYWTNGTKYQDFNVLANSTGYIKYNSEGFGDSRYQEINVTSRRSSFNIFYDVI